MANRRGFEENFNALLAEMDVLKLLKDKVAATGEPRMDEWLQEVESKRRDVDEIQKELEELKGDSNQNSDAKNELNRKVIKILEAANDLKEGADGEMSLGELERGKIQRYSHGDLTSFTENFTNQIGSGAYGDVFKGKLPNGVQVAVKKLKNNGIGVMKNTFMSEVRTMSSTSHRNLVKLYGYCFEVNMKALVYEYLENGSFDKILYENHLNLEWEKLYYIAIETAKGLSYLHESCREVIIHYDVKAGNVLLDSNLFPKVADFGLAKISQRDISHISVIAFRGTSNYAAPEMWMQMPVTSKSDVYSFGMMLFEVLGRRRNLDGQTWFPGHVWDKFEKKQLEKVMEDCGIEDKNKEKAKILSTVALWCTQHSPGDRPTMSLVVQVLEGNVQLRPPPNPLYPYSVSSSSTCIWTVGSTTTSGPPPSLISSVDFPTSEKRLDEKLSDKESENQIVKQQALLNTPAKPMSEHVEIPFAKDNVDALINCVMLDIGFSHGIPVAAFTIYRCLVYWKSFEAEKTSVFDRIIQMIGSAIENQEENDFMAYWLSNTSSLLFLLQKSLNASGFAGSTPRRRKALPATSLFGRMTEGLLTGLDTVRQVEAKYPALLFKQQITAYVEKIYGIIRDKLKKELAPSLSLCIQVPRTSRQSALRSGNISPTSYWRTIVKSLNSLLSILQQDFVPPVLIRKIFIQIFSYINVQLFNSLLLRRECCSFSNGEYLKSGLAELEMWCCDATEEYAGSSWDEIGHIRQAVGFLVIHQKSKFSLDEIMSDLCPILSVQQIYRICTMYWDDKFNTRSVSPKVISGMRELMMEDSNNTAGSSFLLDDDSSIPFSADDISNSLREKDFSDVKPAPELLKNPAFKFLQE